MVSSGRSWFGRKRKASSASPFLIPTDDKDVSLVVQPDDTNLLVVNDAERSPRCAQNGDHSPAETGPTYGIGIARETRAGSQPNNSVANLRKVVERLKAELARAQARSADAPARGLEIAAIYQQLAEEKRENARQAEEIVDLRGQVAQSAGTNSKLEGRESAEKGTQTEDHRYLEDALMINDLLNRVEAIGRELKDEKQKLVEEKRKNEERTAYIARLEEEMRRRREAGARCADERDRFEYVLALNGQTGSISRSVLASDPDSLLYKMYGGDWDYARDNEGRAIVTCHPQRWAAVLEHLATGGVPAERDPLLLEQARHWNLSRLVDGLEALNPGVIVTNDSDLMGFTVRCTFTTLTKQMSTGTKSTRLTFSAPQGRWWAVKLCERGVFLWSVTVPGGNSGDLKKIRISRKWRLLLRSEIIEVTSTSLEYAAAREDDWGHSWGRNSERRPPNPRGRGAWPCQAASGSSAGPSGPSLLNEAAQSKTQRAGFGTATVIFGTFANVDLELSADLFATIVPNGNPTGMGITFHDARRQPVVSPQRVSLMAYGQGYGSVSSPATLIGGAYFISANHHYELALDGGKKYQITPFGGFQIHERSL
ncbi:hypothetical protein KFL_000890080 [Klebsormidium nitens]|uniref:Uncharacterized protein n=1 Tax=Klebsormidium nitens TaxID=105231 RepID=A0A1Y1HX30_KLENI|nr:hypothetical protein KFL_000890080 [Klebsormidium nitens]|eukprot:GAQ81719.1 hypothetical protein KFL_000890080 [Klebsormidium nitens]